MPFPSRNIMFCVKFLSCPYSSVIHMYFILITSIIIGINESEKWKVCKLIIFKWTLH